ncbi:MAG: aspartate 1-decarboxylase [Verrucomicrobiales bacterium]
MRSLLRSKIHLATVTEANVDYVGSITIDRELMDAVGFWPGEKVLISSNSTGARLETYVIEGERNSGIIGINGAAAHLINAGEKVIIMGFELTEKPVDPKVILVDDENKVTHRLHEKAEMLVPAS